MAPALVVVLVMVAVETEEPKVTNANEFSELLQDVVKLFSEKNDIAVVRESSRHLEDLHAAAEVRHKQVLQSIKGACSKATLYPDDIFLIPAHLICGSINPLPRAELSGQVQRQKEEHLERQATLLDPTQKHQLLAERSRVEENIKRLQQVCHAMRLAACGRFC